METLSVADRIDLRQGLYNSMPSGRIEEIQLPVEMITQLCGFVYDIDPLIYCDRVATPALKLDPQAFFGAIVEPWLSRHPVLDAAAVIVSGRGLHVVVRFADPVVFATAGKRRRWAGIIKALQAVLPTDPDAPGITATTRVVGSINSKNFSTVSVVRHGRPVPVQDVLDLYELVRSHPFKSVMQIVFGADRLQPCPVCQGDGTTLRGLDRAGSCYGSCGSVKLHQIYDVFLKTREPAKA